MKNNKFQTRLKNTWFFHANNINYYTFRFFGIICSFVDSSSSFKIQCNKTQYKSICWCSIQASYDDAAWPQCCSMVQIFPVATYIIGQHGGEVRILGQPCLDIRIQTAMLLYMGNITTKKVYIPKWVVWRICYKHTFARSATVFRHMWQIWMSRIQLAGILGYKLYS